MRGIGSLVLTKPPSVKRTSHVPREARKGIRPAHAVRRGVIHDQRARRESDDVERVLHVRRADDHARRRRNPATDSMARQRHGSIRGSRAHRAASSRDSAKNSALAERIAQAQLRGVRQHVEHQPQRAEADRADAVEHDRLPSSSSRPASRRSADEIQEHRGDRRGVAGRRQGRGRSAVADGSAPVAP